MLMSYKVRNIRMRAEMFALRYNLAKQFSSTDDWYKEV